MKTTEKSLMIATTTWKTAIPPKKDTKGAGRSSRIRQRPSAAFNPAEALTKVLPIDFQGKVWTRPSEHIKAKKEHRVPLTPPLHRNLRSCEATLRGSDFIFPGDKHGRPLSNMVFVNDKTEAAYLRTQLFEKRKVVPIRPAALPKGASRWKPRGYSQQGAPAPKVVDNVPVGAVYTVLSEDELCCLTEDLQWLKASEKSFEFWDNPEDAIYDTL